VENSSEYYYNKLKDSITPGNILAALYCTLYSRDITRSEIIMFNRLLKIFDRFLIFFSILDMVGSKPIALDNPYPYLFEICKRRFESAHGDFSIQARQSLDGLIRSLDKQIEEVTSKKFKVPSSKGLEPDGRD